MISDTLYTVAVVLVLVLLGLFVQSLAPTANELCAAHPSWSSVECERIAERKIWLGMDEEQLIASWGHPTDINRTVSAHGSREQWVYRRSYQTSYVYLEEGSVTSWQIYE